MCRRLGLYKRPSPNLTSVDPRSILAADVRPISLDGMTLDRARILTGKTLTVSFIVTKPTYPLLGRTMAGDAEGDDTRRRFYTASARSLHISDPASGHLAGSNLYHHEIQLMATATVHALTVGVFHTQGAAERAIAELKAMGYEDKQIGLVGKDSSGKAVKLDGAGQSHAGEGMAIGAAAGAAGGAAVGIGLLAGVIPVIGPVLAIGTLATILLNAAGGAAVASLAGGLIGWGIPDEEAKYYEEEVKAGRFLVTVDRGNRADDVRVLLVRHGGYDRSTATK